MKLSKILYAAALAAAFSVASRAAADDIIASPKFREMLGTSEAGNAPHTAVVTASVEQSKIQGSPKMQELLTVQSGGPGTLVTVEPSIGYKATGADGITASPRTRQQLDQEQNNFMVVALK